MDDAKVGSSNHHLRPHSYLPHFNPHPHSDPQPNSHEDSIIDIGASLIILIILIIITITNLMSIFLAGVCL